ncbi:hypothetical protein PHYPO_G00168390 [Pangasianodon hypophthalmus]|uniref:ZU5 domain-containing protein n=1 Tax=Pangasianodon hypophthalmus TaxID=310915 RepID=A0A5N5JHG5_PANHP|nr:hypothetical protein PHYPO_G00168390 [Pangasianodon hypophthalmus]
MTEVLDVSDEEGEDTMTGDGGEYLRVEDLRELGDDSLSGKYLDGMSYLSHNLDRAHYTSPHLGYQRDGVLIEDMITSHQVSSLSRENDKDSYRLSWGAEHLDNVVLTNTLLQSGFLVSFMVDARGGAMRGCRHNGLRIIVPPRKCSAPTRVTCRLVKRHRVATMPLVEGDGITGRIIELGPTGSPFLGKLHLPTAPPPLNEGESLVSRILQLGPPGTKFLGPVIVEIPHFAALRGSERELVVLRSETGESWREHHCEHTEEELNQILNGMDEELDSPEELEKKRICRIITRDFPQFFAVVSRIRQDSHLIGPEGGVLSSSLVPQVQAVFPEGALTKRIRVGLQAQPIGPEVVKRILGNKATFSPIVTLEPRRRKFHKPITMTIPIPKTSTNEGSSSSMLGETPTLRLLCSITGGTTPAQWEDITGSTPLTFINQCVSFTTNVSARFWLIDCRQSQESVTFCTQLYREIICVPYMAKFVIFAKTLDPIEARLRCFCMTDDKMDKTLEQQENFTEVARSRDVEVLEGKPIFVDCFGNLVPLTKSGQHHIFSFYAFKENRLALFIKIRDSAQEPCGRLSFTKEPRTYRSLNHNAICNLNITLPVYSKDSDSDQDADEESEKTHDKYEDETESTEFSTLHTHIVHDPATLASPDLLSDVSDMKQDLIKISGFLTNDVSEQSLVDGLKYYVDNEDEEEPFEIVEKVKEDLEKVGKILSVGNFGKETEKSKCSDKEAAEVKSQMIEPLLREVRITRATDCSSAPQKDASEMVSHLSTDLDSYLQHLPVTAYPVQEENIFEETFTEVVLPRKRHPPRIKKPARKKLKEREFVSCSSEDELERMSSEESLDGDTLLGDSELGVPPVSPKVIETSIGSIKDRVKALQKKVEEEEKEESVKVREVRRITAVQSKAFPTMRETEENYTLPPKSPKSPLSQTERIEHSMSVKELMKAFQTGQDPSKSKSGLFEHKAITKLVVTSTTEVSEKSRNAQISDLQTSAIKPSAEEINSQSITGESSQIIHDQYQQNKISDEITHEQAQRTSEDPSVSKTSVDISISNKDSWRPSSLHNENTLIRVREDLNDAPDVHRIQHCEQGETSNMSSCYEEEDKEEILFSGDKIIQNKECTKELCQEEVQAKDSTVTLEVWHHEEEQCSPEILHYKKLSARHERRTSEEPQISPDRKPSEDFSAVIKEELEESPEYQLFIQAAGSSPVSYTSYSETHIIQDGNQVEHTAVVHHSYKPKPAVRFAPAVVQSEKFLSTIIHDEEIDEKLKRSRQAGGDSTDIMFKSRTPITSLGEYEAYEEFKQTAQTSPDQEVKSPTEDQPEEKGAMQLEYTESGSPTKSAVQTRIETQETEEKDQQDQDTVQVTFYMEIKSPVDTELEFMQKSPSDIKSQVQTEQELSFQVERDQMSQAMGSYEVSSVETAESEQFQQMSSRPHALEDTQPVTISDLKRNSPEMTPDKEDISSHKSLDSMQVSSTEIKIVQTELEETHLNETEEVQHLCITTMEKRSVTETQIQARTEEGIGFTVESGISESHDPPVPEETKQLRGIYEISCDEFQENQQMPYSTFSISSTDILDDLQYVTSDPESGFKSDSPEMTSGKEDFSNHKSPDSVQVSSRENKSPVQTERTGLHETEEDREHVYKSTVEKWSLSEIQTQIQTEEEINVNVGVDSPVQDLDDSFQDSALKETKQTRDVYEIFSEKTGESEEYQQMQQRLYSAVTLHDLQSVMTSGPKSACQVDPQESIPVKEDLSPSKSPDSVQVSSTEIKIPDQTELGKTHLHETEEEFQHACITTVEKTTFTETKTQAHAKEGICFTVESGISVQNLDDSYEAPVPEETKQLRGIYGISPDEFQENHQIPYSTSSTSSPDILNDLQYITSDPESGCKSDSQVMSPGKEDVSTHRSPDSVQVSSREIKSPVQTERTGLHETGEDEQEEYKTTVEKFSPTEIQTKIQTKEEINVDLGVDSPVQDLHDPYQVYALKETKQTRDFSSEETAESEEFQELQRRLYSVVNLSDLQPVMTSGPESACQVDPQETTSGKKDLSSPDSVQVSSTEIKIPDQTELGKTHLHETEEEFQHACITTVEKTTFTETKTQAHAKEGICFTVESGISVQNLDDSYEAPVPEETKQLRGIYGISPDEFQENHQIPYSTSSTSSPDILNDLQYITSDPESGCKSDSQVMSPGKEDVSTHRSPDSVQVSSREIKSPVQTERTGLHETGEDEQEEYKTTVEKFSPTEIQTKIQTKEEINVDLGVDSPVQDLHDPYQVYALKETKQTRDFSSEETAESEEFQELQRRLYSVVNLSDLQPVMTSGPESACQVDPQETTSGKKDLSSPDSVQVSSTEIKIPDQTELGKTHLHETEEEFQHACITTVEKTTFTETKTQAHAKEGICFTVESGISVQNLDDSYEAPVPEETKQLRGIYGISPDEFQENHQIPYSTSSTSGPDILNDLQYITSDPESGCKSDSQVMSPGKEDFSTHRSPDSVQVSSREIKSPLQTERTGLHETGEDEQEEYKTTVEKFSPTEIQTKIQTKEEINVDLGVDSPVQDLHDPYQVYALKETKQTRDFSSEETAESEEFQELQRRLYSVVNLSDLQPVMTSGPESACQVDPQETTSGKKDLSSPDSVQVPSTEIKIPDQTELGKTHLHETEVEDQHGFMTIEEKLSSSINVEVEDDCLVQDLDDSCKVSPVKETKQMRGIENVYSVQTAKSEIQQTLSRPDNLKDLQPVTMSDAKSVCQGDSLETTPIKEDLSSNKSPDSIEPSPIKDFLCPDSLETSPTGQRTDSKSPDQLYQTSNDSQNSQPVVSLTENIELEISNEMIIQREAEIPGSQCLSTPIKPLPSPLDEENLQSSGLVQRQATPNEEILYMGMKVGTFDEMKDPEMEKFDSASSVELMVEDMMMTEEMLIRSEDNSSLYSELPDTHEPSVPLKPALEGNDEEDQEIREVKKQFTPEEQMFKMAAKIRVFDEIEKESKTRKVRFDFTTSSQDRDDGLQKTEEDFQFCDESLLDYEEEDTKQKCGPESSIVLSSYRQSEQCDDTPLTELLQEEPGQALSESQVSGCTYSHEYGASEIGEMEMEVLPMQIYIDKKELSQEDFLPECLIKEDKADTMAALAEDSAAMLVDNKTDSNSDIECHIINEKTVEMPQSFIYTVCSVNDGKAKEEHQPHPCGYEEDHGGKSQRISELIQGDLVPWSAELEDDESFNSQIEAEEQKISSQTPDTQSLESTPEMPPVRTPTENGQPNPFLFQEGKLFEMTRGGAIDMSRRSMEEERDAFVFFPISEDPSEDSPCEKVRENTVEFSASMEISLDSKCQDSPQDGSGSSDEPRDSESHSDSESPKEKDLGFDSSIADIDTATSTVTRSIYSEQDLESSDSSAEDDQRSVIEIPTPIQDDLMLPSGETLHISSHWSLSSKKDPAAEPESRKPKSKIPVKATSFDHFLGKADSTEQNQRPKSEADIGLSDFISGVHSSSVKPKTPVSKIPVSVEQTPLGAHHSGQPQHTHEGGGAEKSPDEKDSPQTVLDVDGRSTHLQTPSVGEDIFETRPNWEDCVETQMQRLSDSSSPDQSKVDWNDDADRKEEILSIIADLLGFSWTELAKELEFNENEVHQVRVENPNSLQEQSAALLQRWSEREGKHATEDCLIKKLTKINRMDIVHLIKTQLNKSVQEQTSRTYAEIERTLDHSEALSSVQEVSPRMVRRVDISQKPPAAVSEEDLSVASLLDIPSWAEPVGHAHSESIHGDMVEELEVTQDVWACQEGGTDSAQLPLQGPLSAADQDADQALSEPEDHNVLSLSPAAEAPKPYFFNFSQSAIDKFSHELSTDWHSNQAEVLTYMSRGHAEEHLESPPDDRSPVYEKSDMEESEKSSSEFLQSHLSGSEAYKVLQLTENNQGPGEELTPSVDQMMQRASPEDWTQQTPDLTGTPSESDYVFVNPESHQLPAGEHAEFDSACHYEGNMENQEPSEGWNEVSQITEGVSPEESPQMIIQSVQDASPPEESLEPRYLSEKLYDDQHFSLQEQKPDLQKTHNIYTEDAEMQREVQFEKKITSDCSILKDSILQQDVSPFSHSDVSPQTPDTVRATQHFEFGEVLWAPERTTDQESYQLLTKVPETATSQSSKRPQSESFMSDSPSQFSEAASFSRSFSESDQTTVCSLSTVEALALLQKLVPTENPLTGEGVALEITESIRSKSDDETITKPFSKAEEPEIMKIQKEHAEVLQSALHLPEEQEMFLTNSDYSELGLEQNVAWATCVSVKPQEHDAESLSTSETGEEENQDSVQDCMEVAVIQETLEESEEKEEPHRLKKRLQAYICSSEEAPPHGDVMNDYDDDDDLRRADREADVPPQTETEELYMEKRGTLHITQVSQKAVVRRCASAEDRTEGRAHSRAVKRTVVKSDGDETEVIFTEQSKAAVVRVVSKPVSETVSETGKHFEKTHLDTYLATTNDDITQGEEEEQEFSEVHFAEGCRMEEAGV